MTEEGLRGEAEKLVAYIQSLGNGFAILTAKPENHIGAIIADAVLQVGHRWKPHVEGRVKRIKTAYPQAATLSGLSRLLATVGEKELLNWNGSDEQRRFRQTIEFFSKEEVDGEKIDTVSQLAVWLDSDVNRDRLLTRSPRKDRAGIPRISDKTADYYRVMVGLPDAVAIDSLITKFLRDAGVKGRSQYDKAKAIVQVAATKLSEIRNTPIRPIDLDRSIWDFQSKKEEKEMVEDSGLTRSTTNASTTRQCKHETNDSHQVLKVTIPACQLDRLKKIAREEFGIDEGTLARIWIVERLKQYLPTDVGLAKPPATPPPPQTVSATTIQQKIKNVVEKNWSYGQPFSRRELVNEVQKQYPEVKANEILPADVAINKLSGYGRKKDGTWAKKHPFLFAGADGKYERYDPARHGSFRCVDDGNGYKKII